MTKTLQAPQDAGGQSPGASCGGTPCWGTSTRRSGRASSSNGRLTYDPDRRELRADGEAVKLTATETKIVDLLMRNPGRIFPAEEIYRRVWDGEAAYACENTVMVHIRRIRAKKSSSIPRSQITSRWCGALDTKWNNTTEAVEIEPVMPQRKGTGLRAAAAFLTFFHGRELDAGQSVWCRRAPGYWK